jgi:uncharacterized protein with HEPN domain
MNEIDREWLKDMLECAREAISLLGNRSATELDADRRSLLAVIQSVVTVGEAASHISRQGQAELPGIPWRDIIGMRHRLVHGYRTRSTAILVDTVRDHLPPLVAILERVGLAEDI